MRILISGGGSGGHIFPAISIANELKANFPEIEILFVGAKDRMEMNHVLVAGYQIIGLPVAGFNRKNLLKNIFVLWKLYQSLFLSRKLIDKFQPDIAIGLGGYVSGPILQIAIKKRIPVLIQEQNSVAGITNRLLAKKASKVCVAYHKMEQFFPKEKIVLTGNPIRQNLVITYKKKQEGYIYFKLSSKKKTILVLGGSLGSKTINESMLSSIESIKQDNNIQWIWQTGSSLKYHSAYLPSNIYLTDFISCMDLAYAIADLVISRAGAGSISELCLLKKPVILVPSPNVTENHQTKNAQVLKEANAALIIEDSEAKKQLIPQAISLIYNESVLNKFSENIFKYAHPNAAQKIVDEIMSLFRKNIFSASNFYFIGAGGIGMSNLVKYFLFSGKNVAGYDKVESTITKQLNKLGGLIHYIDDIHCIPKLFKNKKNTIVTITPAIPCSHTELVYFREKGFKIIKRAVLLGLITKSKQAICIAGTHGKTTVSSMIAYLLKEAKIDCNAFLGGISKNYCTNLLFSPKSRLAVVEADEYDYSFHWLSPSMLVITSVDPDHLDIYETKENYEKSFEHFISLIRPGGVLLMEEQIAISSHVKNQVKIYRYSGVVFIHKQPLPDFYAQNVRMEQGRIYFDFIAPDMVIRNILLNVPMMTNVANSVAALAVAWIYGVKKEKLKQGLASFRGVDRRFDFHIKTDTLVLIDDYAHHPKELEQSIISIRVLYPNRKLTIVFQPHLYSRTFNFYQEFARVLSLADKVFLLSIYPAREQPIRGVSSQLILDLVTISHKKEIKYNQVISSLVNQHSDIILMAGAGDIALLVDPVKKALLNSLKLSSYSEC